MIIERQVLLMSCLLAIVVPPRLVMAQISQTCIKEATISEKDARAFESVRFQYEEALESRKNLSNFVLNVQPEEFAQIELNRYYIDVCPSQTVTAIFWGVPYRSGYKCWIIQPVSHTVCRSTKCQNWNGVPWIQGYQFLCKEKYVYENVWSFCVRGRRERTFVLIKVKISKCCACTLAKC